MTSSNQNIPYVLDTYSLPLLWADVQRFNGFIFNDPSVMEKCRLTGQDGLMDSDLRDSRSDNPGRDGEDAYTSYRGGRTISIDGEIKAGNLHSLINLRQRLKAALAGTDDWWFNRYDYIEPWTTAYASNNWQLVSGTGSHLTQSTSSGTLTTSSNDDMLIVRDPTKQNPVIDSRMVTKVTASGSGLSSVGHAQKIVTPGTVTYANSVSVARGSGLTGDMLIMTVNANAGSGFTLEVWRIQDGSALQLYVKTVTTTVITTAWFVSEIRGNDISMALYDKDPRTDNTALQLKVEGDYGTYTLTGSNATKYGSGVASRTGVYARGNSTGGYQSVVKDHSLEGINPSDALLLDVRRSSSIAGREMQENDQYKRVFQVAMRSPDPLIHSHMLDVKTLKIGTTATITNYGDEDVYPEIIHQGSQRAPTVNNLTTGESFVVAGDLSTWKSFDMRTGVATGSDGLDASAMIDPGSNRLKLIPGANSIQVTGSLSTSTSQTRIRFRSGWA